MIPQQEKSWLETMTRPRRILVVEDDEFVADTIARKLSHFNVQLCLAKDGEAAVRLFESFEPQAVILDLSLPLLDGFEVFRYIRNVNRILPVVIVTGRDYNSDLTDRVYKIGYASFLRKPLDISDEFLEAIFSPFSLQKTK